MTASEKRWLAVICVAMAVAVGWIPLHFHGRFAICLVYLGVIGAIPFMLLNGVHGDMEGLPGFAGGVLFVLVNAAVYYGILSFLVKRLRSRKQKTDSTHSRS